MSAKRTNKPSPVLAIRIAPQLRRRLKLAATKAHQTESQYTRAAIEERNTKFLEAPTA